MSQNLYLCQQGGVATKKITLSKSVLLFRCILSWENTRVFLSTLT